MSDPTRPTARHCTPEPSSDDARRRMQATRQTGTRAELLLREALDNLNLTYNIDVPPIPGVRCRPDISFPDARVAVFVDGCFWHGCPTHGTSPKSNANWWQAKLEANRIRDVSNSLLLKEAGWLPLRFWEHDDPSEAARIVADQVAGRLATDDGGEG
jgi:DNA mismatch endonuclease, patch repair protein